MSNYEPTQRTWIKKFADSFLGIASGVRGQSSFVVHLICAAAVGVVGGLLGASPSEWCILVLSIALVLTAEMFNSALERMAKAVDLRENPHLADGLNIASAAVLLAALGAGTVGAVVFVPKAIALILNAIAA